MPRDEEVAQLRRELARVTMAWEFLRGAAAFFRPRRMKWWMGGIALSPALVRRHRERDFFAAEPESVSVADITQIPTHEGKLYLRVMIDLYSKGVISWSIHHRQDREMAIRTAEIAHWHRRRTTAVILRSDCGCQRTSVAYQRFLAHKAHNLLISSMNAVEHCGDNASCEGFLGILKWRCVLRSTYATLDATRADLFD